MTTETQVAAAHELRPGLESLGALLALLGDPDWRARKAAVEAVHRFRDVAALPQALVDGLASDDNAGLRNSCSEALVALGEQAVAVLAASMRTPDADQRKFVVEILGMIGTEASRRALLAGLDDADVNVQAAVAEALGRIGGEENARALRTRLAATTAGVQLTVYLLDALAQSRGMVPWAELERFVSVPNLRRSLLPVLGACRDERAIAPAIAALTAPIEGVRMAAVRATAQLASELGAAGALGVRRELARMTPAVESLEAMLELEDDTVAGAVVEVLGVLGDVARAPRLLAAAACRPFVEVASRAVIRQGSAVVAPLLDAFDHVGVEARVLYLEAIEAVGDASAAKPVLDAARGLESRTVEASIRVAGKLGGEDIVEPLFAMAGSEDGELARHAAGALIHLALRFPEVVALRVRAAAHAGSMRAAWPLVLSALGDERDMPLVVQAMHHDRPEVRAAAVEAAAGYGDRFPSGPVVLCLADEHVAVRIAAARALARYRSDEVAEALLAAARDHHPLVVAEAVRALANKHGIYVVATLLDAVGASAAPIAIAALQSLFRINPPELELAVRRGLEHIDSEVVREAVDISVRLAPEVMQGVLVGALRHRSWNVRHAAAQAIASRGVAVPRALVEEAYVEEHDVNVKEALFRLLARLQAAERGRGRA